MQVTGALFTYFISALLHLLSPSGVSPYGKSNPAMQQSSLPRSSSTPLFFSTASSSIIIRPGRNHLIHFARTCCLDCCHRSTRSSKRCCFLESETPLFIFVADGRCQSSDGPQVRVKRWSMRVIGPPVPVGQKHPAFRHATSKPEDGGGWRLAWLYFPDSCPGGILRPSCLHRHWTCSTEVFSEFNSGPQCRESNA